MTGFDSKQGAVDAGLAAIEGMLGSQRPPRVGEEGKDAVAPTVPSRNQDDFLEEGEGEETVPVSALKDRLSRQAKKYEKDREELERLRAENESLRKKSQPDLAAQLRDVLAGQFQDTDEMSAEDQKAQKLAEVIEGLVTTRASEFDRKLQDMQFMQSLSVDQREAVGAVRELYPSIVDHEHLLALAKAQDPIAFDGEPGHGGRGAILEPGRGSLAQQNAERRPGRDEMIRKLHGLPEGDTRRAQAGPLLVEQMLEEQGAL